MPELGRVLLVVGALLVVFGLVLTFSGRLPFLGKLPGDIAYRRGNFTFYFPIVTSIVLSLLLNGIASDKSLAAIPAPAEIIFVHEAKVYWRVAQVRPCRAATGANRYMWLNHELYDLTHNDGNNMLFCDGHAKWQRKDSMRFAQFGAPRSLNPSHPEYLVPGPAAAANAQGNLVFTSEF